MKINALKLNPDVNELIERFRIKYGVMDAEAAMVAELIEVNLRLIDMERRFDRLSEKYEKEVHRAFHRMAAYELPQAPLNRKTPFLADDHTSDDWLITGRETEAA
jgi:hypothetical protein